MKAMLLALLSYWSGFNFSCPRFGTALLTEHRLLSGGCVRFPCTCTYRRAGRPLTALALTGRTKGPNTPHSRAAVTVWLVPSCAACIDRACAQAAAAYALKVGTARSAAAALARLERDQPSNQHSGCAGWAAAVAVLVVFRACASQSCCSGLLKVSCGHCLDAVQYEHPVALEV